MSIINKFVRRLHVNSNLLARISFNLSDIGEGIREVDVKQWYVAVGDKVKQFDEICEVQSDKASVTITSRYDGIITKLYYDVEQTALVGKPLIDIETDDNASSNHTDDLKEEQCSSTPSTIKETEVVQEDIVTNVQNDREPVPSSDILCIPSVRRLAKEHKLDLTNVKGTGKNGRILKEDVLRFMEEPITKTTTTSKLVHIKKEKLTSFQTAMVKTMTASSKIPQFLYSDEITITALSNLKKTLRNEEDIKISVLPFFVKAISNALSKYPILNSSLDEQCQHIIYHQNHNIGIAMDTSKGLAVPVIKNVQEMGIMDISLELQRLLKSGKEGTFAPSDLSEGTFTISNIGSIGGTYTKPLILPPQVAILGVGSSKVVPRFNDAQNVIPQEVVNVSASGDHRIIDGATMARFVGLFKRQLESPHLLFLNI